MTQLNWQTIAAENPNALHAFYKYMDEQSPFEVNKKDFVFALQKHIELTQLVGYLLGFFDEHGIYVDSRRAWPGRFLAIIDAPESEILFCFSKNKEWVHIVDESTSNVTPFLFDYRDEALAEGFTFAFSLLNDRLSPNSPGTA